MNLRKDHYRVLAAAVASQLSSSANEQTRHHGGCGQPVCLNPVREFRGVPVSISVVYQYRRSARASGSGRCLPNGDGSKNSLPETGGRRPACSFFVVVFSSTTTVNLPLYIARPIGNRSTRVYDFRRNEIIIITLSGGSLGSCVDEERSQLREVM